jgi:hypothetical protein
MTPQTTPWNETRRDAAGGADASGEVDTLYTY